MHSNIANIQTPPHPRDKTAYKSLTTPAPEYVNVVWYPYIKVGSEKLDKFKIELQGLFAIYTTGMPARRNHTEQTYNLWEIGRE